jgi:hypothetical protein
MLLPLAVTAAAVVVPTPHAHAGIDDCAYHQVCVWAKTDYRGDIIRFRPGRFVGRLCISLPFRSIKLRADGWIATAYVGERCNARAGGFADYTSGAYESDIFPGRNARSLSFTPDRTPLTGRH